VSRFRTPDNNGRVIFVSDGLRYETGRDGVRRCAMRCDDQTLEVASRQKMYKRRDLGLRALGWDSNTTSYLYQRKTGRFRGD
jgi:hypothetical protein